MTLAALDQAFLDRWVIARPRSRRHLVLFLKWAEDQQLCPALEIHGPRASDPIWFVADETRWALARRMLTDTDLEPRDRVAGALVLLYGQMPCQITRLTRAHLSVESGTTRLRLGRDLLELPAPLDGLIDRLPETAPVGMAGNVEPTAEWLFPGRRPGTPMSPTHLARRLRALGIEPRAARNTALLQLAAELPSVALADLLGLSISTAERWNVAAGSRWTRYASTRRT
jgi:hypothetical protein